MLRERRRKAAFCIAKGEIRKAEADAPSQGRAKFQKKFTPDRISPLRKIKRPACLLEMPKAFHEPFTPGKGSVSISEDENGVEIL